MNSIEDRSKYFGSLNVYLSNLFELLWENPKLISIILLNSPIEDVQSNLADFFTNNFYENILSSKCIENNLLYLITLLLQDEVNNLLNKDSIEEFLDSTHCGFILEKLKEKKEIKFFFKKIIFDVLEKIKELDSITEFNLDPKKIKENIIKNKEVKSHRKIEINNNVERNNKRNNFQNKYIKPLKENDIKEYLSNYKKETNKNNMNDFINKINNNIITTPSLYETKIFTNNANNEDILNIYEDFYFKIYEFIDIILDNILNNIYLLPYPIKCICKIISQFIQKKFPNIDIVENNAFIGKFLFYNLFLPMLINPCYSFLINDFIISKKEKEILLLISQILKKLVLGQLFKDNKIEGNFTPFNWMIIEKMPKLLDIYNNITNVKLPDFIEKLINNELNEYKYNFLEENKDDVLFYNSICFTIDDLYILIQNIKLSKEKIFKENDNNEIQILIEKVLNEDNFNLIKNLKNEKYWEIVEKNDFNKIHSCKLLTVKNIEVKENNNISNINKNKGNKTTQYFLINFYKYNFEFQKYLNIKNKKSYYSIEENKKEKEEKEEKENKINIDKNIKIINKVKNCLIAILYNYCILNEEDFLEEKRKNTINILNEMEKKMKSLNILIDGIIPSKWYINTLLEYLDKLPQELINNDYEKLYIEIENDLKDSIKNINFEEISIFMYKLKLAENEKIYYENAYRVLIDIDLNKEINNIIKKALIPVLIKYKKNKNYLSIKPITIKENEIKQNEIKVEKTNSKSTDNKIDQKICKTIEDFINHFPNLSKEAYNRKISVLVTLKDTKFPEKLNNYIKLIENTIKEKIIKNETKLNLVINKIYDYIMEKIYLKIFPLEIEPTDAMIYLSCNKASWIEPKHLIKIKDDFIYSTFISDISDYFEKIDKQKCPKKKFFYMEEIFKSISYINNFNGTKMEGIDEEIQMLNYALIKAKPKKIYSNCEYMRLFIGNRKGKREDIHLTQVSVISEQVAKLNASYLINITESEYNEKCKKNISKLFN